MVVFALIPQEEEGRERREGKGERWVKGKDGRRGKMGDGERGRNIENYVLD